MNGHGTCPKHLSGGDKLHAYMYAHTNDLLQANVEANHGFISSLKQTVDKVQHLGQSFRTVHLLCGSSCRLADILQNI